MRWSSSPPFERAGIRAAAWALSLAVAACVAESPAHTHREPTREEWAAAHEALAALRESSPRTPYVLGISVGMREPRTQRRMDARGALAVDPGKAMRMILVGPGGATALDAWVTQDAYRLAVPAIDVVRRGGAGPSPGLPIGFFRWWFLSPLAGRLLSVETDAARTRYVLRDATSTVDLLAERPPGQKLHLEATRREGDAALEHLDATCRESLSPSPGDHATYEQAGLVVEVHIEALGADPPDPAAFINPEHGGVPL